MQKYILVEFPDSQLFMENKDCYLNEDQSIFVPEEIYYKTIPRTVQNLKEEIFSIEKPKDWRLGQFVFNMIDQLYGIARHIQFVEKVDCFYDDSKIDIFLEKAAKIINECYENCNTRTSH